MFSINRNSIAILAILTSVMLISCKKESSNLPEDQTVTEQDATRYSEESLEADASFDDVQDISMTAADDESIASAGKSAGVAGRLFPFVHLRLRIGQCADITVSPNDSTYPKTVTIDFGDGCIGLDGKFRKGKIELYFTGPIRRHGSVLTITLVNFQLNRARVEGTKVISNLGENGNIKFTVQVTGGKVTFPNGRGYQYECLKYVKQIVGGATEDIMDDVFSKEGRSKTTFNSGVVITLNTEDPLIKKVICPWVSEGTLKIKVNQRAFAIDYGFPNNGDCDNKALLTWNNNQAVITLP